MNKIFYLTVVLVLLFIAPAFSGSGPDIREGRWEITTSVDMPGMPVSIPPQKHIQCITRKDLVPQNSGNNQDCEITEQNISGNTVTWKMRCKSAAGTTTGSGQITYGKDTFSGTFTSDVPQANMKMTSKMSGRRIGPCK